MDMHRLYVLDRKNQEGIKSTQMTAGSTVSGKFLGLLSVKQQKSNKGPVCLISGAKNEWRLHEAHRLPLSAIEHRRGSGQRCSIEISSQEGDRSLLTC
jgi:hypothetical protein